MDIDTYKTTSYRYDIQGVRAIGAMLIMVYHIWFSKVSGGVDVFFVVSGYFMAGMLARSYLKDGQVNPWGFWGKIIIRIAPLCYTVIAATLVLGFFLMPAHLWRGGVNEVFTSALQIENWQLIRVGTDYLTSSDPRSPFQQFWALSLQVQFYVILPFALYLSIFLSKFFGISKFSILKSASFIVVLIIALSFGFSVYYTAINPSAAYFHTASRAWEFFVGVGIFIGSPFIALSLRNSRILMWLGFLLLLAVGLFVPESATYPGYIAILPVAAAGMMIVGGIAEKNGYIYRLLSSKVLVYIGGISFSLYLWHWPILIYFQHYSATTPGDMSMIEGFTVIGLAFALSVASKKWIENPFLTIRSRNKLIPYFIGLLFLIPVLLSSYYVRSEVVKEFDKVKQMDYVADNYYHGESAYVQEGPSHIGLGRFIGIYNDLTKSYLDECGLGMIDGKIVSCSFGDKSSDRTVLLVGGSRLGHWEPMFSHLGKKNNFKVITAILGDCSFGYHPKNMTDNHICNDWNKEIVGYISRMNPQPRVVVVNSSRSDGDGEFMPHGYLKNIKEILSLDIPVIGIRINPTFNTPNSCLWRNSKNAYKCATSYSSSLKPINPAMIVKEKEKLKAFYAVDFTNILCRDGLCPAVFDGYPTMRDKSHFTESYILYLSEALEESLDSQVGGFLRLLE